MHTKLIRSLAFILALNLSASGFATSKIFDFRSLSANFQSIFPGQPLHLSIYGINYEGKYTQLNLRLDQGNTVIRQNCDKQIQQMIANPSRYRLFRVYASETIVGGFSYWTPYSCGVERN